MRKVSLILLMAGLLGVSSAGLQTDIYYSVEPISGNQWIYRYIVSNQSLMGGIEEFTIWFDQGKYTSIQKASDPALNASWDQIVWQPNESLKSNGGFDALALTVPIVIGESISGFAVSFVWEGSGIPGSQYYEIVNPDNPSHILDSGFTSPEPVSSVLLLSGSVYMMFKNRK